MASSPPPRQPPALMEELEEEILLRLPLDEPVDLARAALVCKPWRRILSDRNFRRRFSQLHRSPPLFGYIPSRQSSSDGKPRIIPTSTASFPVLSPPVLRQWWVLDCRHGRVLIISYQESAPLIIWDPITGVSYQESAQLIIWDPITGDQKRLSVPTYPSYPYTIMTGAVLCAVDGCDHLDCHGGPFRVVSLVGKYHTGRGHITHASVYTSETCTWSSPTSICTNSYPRRKPSLLIGDVLYFTQHGISILRYDLSKHALSVIETPRVPEAIIMAADQDGGLRLVSVLDDSIVVWSLNNANTNEGTTRRALAQQFVMELGTLLPNYRPRLSEVVGSVEGTDIIFVKSNMSLFTLNLKSQQARNVGQGGEIYNVLPYTSFCNPAGTQELNNVLSVLRRSWESERAS